MNPKPKDTGFITGRINSFRYAFQGLSHLVRTQRNFTIHCLVAFLVLLLGWFTGLSRMEWIVLVLTITLVMTLEAVNTVLELIVDIVSPEFSTAAGRVKDVMAAAVLLAAIGAIATGLILFIPKIQPIVSQILSLS